MPTRNVNLSPKQARFIRQSVDQGGFRNASEVVRAGLRLLEQQRESEKLKLQLLRKMATQSFDEIDSGACEIVDLDDLDQFMERVSAKSGKSKTK